MMETIIISVLSTTIIFLFSALVFQNLKIRTLGEEIVSLTMQNLSVNEKVENLLYERENLAMHDQDGFIKFLSDSRDWAFEYIENVQLSIENLAKAIDSGEQEEISKSFKEIMEYLPDNKGKND